MAMTIDELLQLQSVCWHRGQPKLIEELVADPQALSTDDLLNLVCNEVRLKCEAGQAPLLTEYQQRFSFLSAELEMQWAIDALLYNREPTGDLTASAIDDGSALQSPMRKPSLPTNIGRYEILREIGRGAAGIIYEGFDANLNRSVAIKCLRTDYYRSSIEAQRFRLEAETAGRLRHPNIAQVYDSGREDDISFIVMEYCEQGTLAKLVGQPLPVPRVLAIMLQLTSAVSAAHSQGIIHRDLKPANVLLSSAPEGELICKVADFGLAKWVDEESSATVTGTFIGSPAYMSPEQASGKPSDATFQADVYALGAILFQLLTGRPPFLGVSIADTLHQIRYTDPLEIRQLNPSAPIDLETIAAKCLHKSPTYRYSSAQELFDELTRFDNGDPIHAKPEGLMQKFRRLARRNPQAASLVAVTFGLLLIIAVGSTFNARRLRKERQRAMLASQESRHAETRSHQALESLQESEKQRRLWVFRSLVDEAWAAFDSRKQGQRLKGEQALQRLVSVYPYSQMNPDQQLEVRSVLAACLSQPDLRELGLITTDGHLGHSVDVDPFLKFAAFPDKDHRTVLQAIQDGSKSVLAASTSPSGQYSLSRRWFSPDGNWICESLFPSDVSLSRSIRVLQRDSGEEIFSCEGSIDNFCFDPNGRQFFFVRHSCIEVYDLITGQFLRRSTDLYRGCSIDVSPNGKWLAVWGNQQTPKLLDPNNWQVLDSIPVDRNVLAATWKGDSSQLMLATENKMLFIWNLQRRILSECGHFPVLERGILTLEPGVSIRLDSRSRMAAISGVLRTQLVDLFTDNPILEFPGEVLRLDASERRLVVRQGERVLMNQLIPSEVCAEWKRPVSYAEFSPSGRWLAISGEQGAQFLDTELLEYGADLELDPAGPVVWSPAENELITYGIFSHLCRWPAGKRPNRPPGEILLGPPKSVVLNPTLAKLGADDQVPQHEGRFCSWHPDGSQFFFSDNRHGRVYRVDAQSGTAEVLFQQPGAHQLDVSPNGQFLAVSNVRAEEVLLWEISTRRIVRRWNGGNPRFSNDGRHLVLGRRESSVVIDTSTWDILRQSPTQLLHPFHPVPVEVHPNGKFLAVAHSPSSVRLLDIASGETIQDLVYRDPDTIRWLSFNADGTKLAVTRTSSFSFWDLSRLGLDMVQVVPQASKLLDVLNLAGSEQNTTSLTTEGKLEVVVSPNNPTMGINDTGTDTIQVDRGSELLPPGRWWTGYQLLAYFEALKLNYPDAIDNLDKAIKLIAVDDHQAIAEVLLLRSQYHLAGGNAPAALIDLRQAVTLRPEHLATKQRLADLLLNGPDDVRDPIEGNIVKSRVDLERNLRTPEL